MNFTDLEKERLKLKIIWEGGLEQFIKYGVGTKLYSKYKKEFDDLEIYTTKKQKWHQIKHFLPQKLSQ